MSIIKFTATKDNTITNAFKAGNRVRGTSGNMGASDILEVFSIYARATTSSVEQSRILIEFPIDDIIGSRSAGQIPASGSVKFRLKMFNARHSDTTPDNFSISVFPISSSWSEGSGLDMENYSDLDASNWISSSVGSAWSTEGGDYITGSYTKQVFFDTGLENLDIDVSDIVESWIKESLGNHGFLLKLSGSAESGETKNSFYTKRFFGRNSEFILQRPVIEAQFDNSIKDDRNNIQKSSSLSDQDGNKNTIYYFNRVRGNLKDIPNTGSNLLVQLYGALTSSANALTASGPDVSNNFITASKHSTGVYKAEFEYSDNESKIYDVWQITSSVSNGYIHIHTGSAINVVSSSYLYNTSQDYILNITNLKSSYIKDEKANFRIYTRNKNWSQNIYSKATNSAPVDNIRELYYKITRVSDNFNVVSYSTSSAVEYSRVSYDVSGSFFDLDMSILEPNYLYEISFLCKKDENYTEQKERFRFRVDP